MGMHSIMFPMLLSVVQACGQHLVVFAQSECTSLQQQNLDMTRSPADADKLVILLGCEGNVCPWCILDARHGYLDEAYHRVAQLKEQLSSESPPEAAWILMHCQRWCEKLCEKYDVKPRSLESPEPRPSPTDARTGTASSSAACPPPPPEPPRERMDAAAVRRPPPWARPPPRIIESLPTHVSPAPIQQLNEEGVPVPGHLDAQWEFECWTGPSRKWVAYPEPTQRLLRAAYNSRAEPQRVLVNDVEMEISVTPDDMWQNNRWTENPPRKVRLAPKGGWPD